MSLKQYNRTQILEALINSDTPENIQDYQKSVGGNPSIKELTMFYLDKHTKEFRDKNQTLLNLNEQCSS